MVWFQGGSKVSVTRASRTVGIRWILSRTSSTRISPIPHPGAVRVICASTVRVPSWPGLSFTSWPAGTITARTSRFTTKGSFSCLRIAALLGGDRRRTVLERRIERVPAEARALHARRKFPHSGQRGQLAERAVGFGPGACQQRVHLIEQLADRGAVLALDRLRPQGRRGGGPCAAPALEADDAGAH